MLVKNDLNLLPAAAEIYRAAYGEEPWNEAFDSAALTAYLRAYAVRDGLIFCLWLEDSVPAGLALCSVIPFVGGDFARIEDFCIAPQFQRRGVGSRFIDALCADLLASGCDSALLATQKSFPAEAFYRKNGFTPLDSSVQLFRQF